MSWPLIILLMFVLFALNMRLYLAMFAAVLAYFLIFSNLPLPIAIQRFAAPAQNPSLLAIPFFILLGTLLSVTGIAHRLLKLADLLVGRMIGGLGHTAVLLSTLLGGISASNLADAAMMCKIIVPEMVEQGYKRGTAAAITAASALITPIIPPGIALIIYALVADVSIGSMFMAGILPGLLCAIILSATVHIAAKKYNLKASRVERISAQESLKTIVNAWPALFLIVIIIGGIRLAIFTPTEAGAVATVITLIIGFFFYRDLKISEVIKGLSETARQTAAILLLIMASGTLAWIFSNERAGISMAEFIIGLTTNKWLFLLSINIFLLVLGMFVEGTALMIILVPLLKPVLGAFGIDPVHFGIIMVLNLSIGTLTPPVGTVMLLVCNMTKTSLIEFLRGGWLFLSALLLALLIITYIPAISLLLV